MKILAVAVALSAGLLSGCAVNMKVPVKNPVPSAIAYDTKAAAPERRVIGFVDERSVDEKAKLLSGLIPMQMVQESKPFDAVPWVATHTVKELAARGLPVTLADAGQKNDVSVLIKRLHIENHRTSGFSPFITFTSLRADLETPAGTKRVTSYVKRGKVPVWSFDEVIDPTFNDPLAVLSKELAAKLNSQVFKQKVADEQIEVLVARINADASKRDDTFLDVYQLGFSNNPKAIPELVKLAAHPSEYVRLAAISSLGILNAVDQMDFLVGLYESRAGIWQDRAMALKAIGDLDTPASRDYMKKEWSRLENRTDKEALWTKEIIALYL